MLPLQMSHLAWGGGAWLGAISAPADPTGAQRTPGTCPACLCTSRRHPQTAAHTPKGTFIRTCVPTRDWVHVPRAACTRSVPAQTPGPTNLSLSGAELVAGQAQEASPQGGRGGTQCLEPPPATRGLIIAHPSRLAPLGLGSTPQGVVQRR